MHLLEKYSLNCGINPNKLDKPYIFTSYYPVSSKKYIVVHPSSGMPSKNYSYYQEVIDFIHEAAEKAKYEIIQIGEAKDPALSKCTNLQGKTNIHQTCFLLKGASLFIGNDSFSTHVSSAYGKPLVSLYSTIQPEVAGPYWKNGKQFTIMAPLNGKKPKYSLEDPEKIIDKIMPEEIISNIQKALPDLDLKKVKKLKSIYIGKNYNKPLLDVVPNSENAITFAPQMSINIRFDYLKNEPSEFNILSACNNILKRKSGIVVSKPINLNKFTLPEIRQNILSFIFHIEKEALSHLDNIIEFISEAKKRGFDIKIALIGKNFTEEELADIKFKLFNLQHVNIIQETSWEEEIKKDASSRINNLTIFKSSRIIFSQNKAFLSKAAYIENKPADSLQQPLREIKDLEALGKELENCYIYNL